jgi:hypothetical protein
MHYRTAGASLAVAFCLFYGVLARDPRRQFAIITATNADKFIL